MTPHRSRAVAHPDSPPGTSRGRGCSSLAVRLGLVSRLFFLLCLLRGRRRLLLPRLAGGRTLGGSERVVEAVVDLEREHVDRGGVDAARITVAIRRLPAAGLAALLARLLQEVDVVLGCRLVRRHVLLVR